MPPAIPTKDASVVTHYRGHRAHRADDATLYCAEIWRRFLQSFTGLVVSALREDLAPRGGEEDAHGAGLAVDQRRRARDALARRALNVVVVVLMACVIVAAKPLSSNRGSISLSNLRVLGHEIAVGHAQFLLDTPAREGANVLPSASAGAV